MLIIILGVLCSVHGHEANAQLAAAAGPANVAPMPVDPSLMQPHPATVNVTNPPTPSAEASGAESMVTPAGLAVAVGRTPGQFAVSPTGQAIYSIPLWTPPGARGLQPHLSLVYASGTPDGLMGPGWSLSGLSTITRCGATWAQDGNPSGIALTSADKYCLDGRRLRVTSGVSTYGQPSSTYQTEIANFSNVTASSSVAGNGPAYFTVKGKDGLTYEYGNTTDSRVIASGATPYLWALDKISDRQGNNLILSYTQSNGSYVPHQIQYTQTPATGTTYHNVVTFAYTTRAVNAYINRYVAGGAVQTTTVLSTITVTTDSATVRTFTLSYANGGATGQPRLSTLQECSASDCLAATTIGYQDGVAGVANPTTSAGTGAVGLGFMTADIDGDGHADLLYYIQTGTSAHWWVKFGTASGFGAAVDTTLTTNAGDVVLLDDFLGEGKNSLLAPQSGVWATIRWNGTAFVKTPTTVALPNGGVAHTNQCATADVNGDGLPDLICINTATSEPYIQMNTSTTSVSFQATATAIPTGGQPISAVYGNNQFTNSNVRHLDFNGDGHQDLIVSNPADPTPYYGILLSTGATTAPGLTLVTPTALNTFPIPINFNNDACTDLVSEFQLYIWGCNGASAVTLPLPGIPVLVADWDGDGRTDIWIPYDGSTLQVYLSEGDALNPTPILTDISLNPNQFSVLDLNGDGLDDIAIQPPATLAITFGLHNGAGTPPDLATSFTDGYGMNVSPSYVSIAENNYTKYTDGGYPDVDWAGPMSVVASLAASDGAGGTYNQAFWYYGAHINLNGRGLDGFYAFSMYDNRNGLYAYKYYSRSFPTTGMMAKNEVSQNSSGTIPVSTTVYTPNTMTLDATANNERYFPYVSESVETDDEVGGAENGDAITQIAKTYVFDVYGNATSVTTATSDTDANSPWYEQTWQTEVVKTIAPNTTDWCLNLPTQVTMQKSIPGGTSLTRTTSLTPDYVNCRITATIAEPSSSTLKVSTTYGFDTCGNVNSTAVVGSTPTGSAMPTRTTTANYGTHCEFPESITNAQSEATAIGYNYALGVPSSTKDPNNLTTSWTYDNYGRMTLESRPDGTSTSHTITACTAPGYCGVSDLRWYMLTKDLDTTGATIRYSEPFFDGFDRQRYDERVNLSGAITTTARLFDQLGNVHQLFDPWIGSAGGYHVFTVDLLNRMTKDDAYQVGGTLYRETDAAYAGREVTLTDAKANVTKKWLDVAGRLRTVTDPTPGGTTNFQYEPFGHLISVTDAASNVTSRTYNLRGYETSSSDPDRGSWTFSPDSLGEVVSQTDAKSQTASFVFDKLSRMTSRTEAEGTSTWTWGSTATSHNYDRLQSMTGPGYSESYTYDSVARLITTTYSADTTYTISRAYNTTTQLLDNVTYPSSTGTTPLRIQYAYTNGILRQVNDYNTPATVYWNMSSQDAHWNPTTEILGNGVQILSSYDDLTGHLNSRKSGDVSPYTNQQNITFDWDKNENLTDRIDVNQGSLDEHFTYDTLNRMTGSTLAGIVNFSVGFDATGNITTTSANGAYTYDPVHAHAVKSTGGWNFTYDANGNMLTGRGATLGWTSYNLPSTITNGTMTSAFSYTPDRRYWKQSAVYSNGPETSIYIGGLFEKVSNATVTDYHHLISAGSATVVLIRSTGTNNDTYYVTQDHLSSSSVITNHVGSEILNESFSPYGVRRGSDWSGSPSPTDWTNIASTTRHGLTGHTMLDNVGLIHMNGRVFDSLIDRFVSADPVMDRPNNSQTINPYGYVANNPLSLTDPTGFDGCGVNHEGDCGNKVYADNSTDTGSGSGAGSGADAGSASDAGSGADAGSGSDAGSGADAGSGSNAESAAGANDAPTVVITVTATRQAPSFAQVPPIMFGTSSELIDPYAESVRTGRPLMPDEIYRDPPKYGTQVGVPPALPPMQPIQPWWISVLDGLGQMIDNFNNFEPSAPPILCTAYTCA